MSVRPGNAGTWLDSARELVTAVNEGRLSMKDIDLCVDHVLDAVLDLKQKAEEKSQFLMRKPITH